MNKKYIYIFMQLFTSICLISVGFASWTFVCGDSITASGNIVAQDVHTDDNYIKLESTEVFRYYDTGFVSGTEDSVTITDTGTLVFNYKIDLYNCEQAITSTNATTKFNVLFTLSHATVVKSSENGETTYYKFIDDCLTDCTYTENPSIILVSKNSATNDNLCDLSINLFNLISAFDGSSNSDNRYVDFSITYTFNVGTLNFKNDIYPCLAKEEFEFIMKTNIDIE